MSDDAAGAPAPAAALDAPNGDPSTQAAAEGVDVDEDDVGSSSQLREMLTSTDPERRLEDVESPWDPERGGLARVYRGLGKMMDLEGMPAVVDVVIGAAEWVTTLDLEGDGDDGDGDRDGEGEANGPVPDAGGV